ncbi:hypothetical protein NH340_JMT03980 [Sarcoptes scabiei]|nr:hypothetical protein NH340_JMT03980 [Sarcoptes scabiei]
MPTYDDRKKSFNYYGILALWASILLLGSYCSLYSSGCEQIASQEIQISLVISCAIGLLIFLLSFCDISNKLYYAKFIFYLIVLIIASISVLLLYTSYQTLGQKCTFGKYYERNFQIFHNFTTKKDDIEQTLRSIHQSRNNHYLASAILDLLSSVLFAGCAYTFRNRL